jgi:hypothetical protein
MCLLCGAGGQVLLLGQMLATRRVCMSGWCMRRASTDSVRPSKLQLKSDTGSRLLPIRHITVLDVTGPIPTDDWTSLEEQPAQIRLVDASSV